MLKYYHLDLEVPKLFRRKRKALLLKIMHVYMYVELSTWLNVWVCLEKSENNHRHSSEVFIGLELTINA